MTDLRKQLKAEFEKLDTDKTGFIGQPELEALLTKLNNFKAEELKLIFSKLEITDGKVKFDDFIDLFAGGKTAPNPALAKKPTEDELEIIKDTFKKYDRDSSGQIDLKELQAMCETLGKKLPDEQAAAAMQQLDKNGDMVCNFDEFLLWYTSTTGMGGYSHVALGFMKARMAVEGGIRKIKKRARKTIDNIDEFSLKVTFDVSPEMAKPSKEACSATCCMKKAEGPTNAVPRATMQLTCKDPDVAASIIANCEKIAGDPEMPMPLPATFRQDKEKIFFSLEAPPDMFEDEGLTQALGFLEDCMKKLEGKFSLGVNFQDALKNPDRPLLLHFQGLNAKTDVNIGLTALASFFAKDGIPPEAEAALKVLAAIIGDAKLVYNEPSIMLIASKLKEMFKAGDWKYAKHLKLLRIATGSLSDARALMYENMGTMGAIQNEKWSEEGGPPVEKVEKVFNLIREMGAGIVSLDEIVIDGIPGSTVQFFVTFDQINPFPLADYFWGSYPKDPRGTNGGALNRTQSSAETDKLKAAFEKYDKDKSGAIDLKELKEMILELGGKITEEEVTEAMAQLDRNSDGTCSFEEFKEFWSSKSGLGGYGSMALKFLKAKLALTGKLEAGKKMLAGASGYVGESSAADTVVKYMAEMSPKMEEVPDKMSLLAAIDQVDVKAEGPPRVYLRLGAKDGTAAGEIVQKVNEALELLKDMMEMMGINVKVEVVGGKNIEVSISPPDGAVDSLYSEEDMMRTLTPLIKALKQSNAKLVWGNEFDDFLGKPDTPMPEVYAGCKAAVELFVAAKGKQLVLDALPGKSKLQMQVLIEVIKMFAGAELAHAIGFHPANLAALVKVNEMAATASTPSGLRGMAAAMVPLDDMPLAEMKPFIEAGVYCLDRLDSIESVGLVNVDLPVEFAANGLPATVGATVTCNNVKPFGFVKYIVEPTLDRFKELTAA